MRVTHTVIALGFGLFSTLWVAWHLFLISQYGVVGISEPNEVVLWSEIAGFAFFSCYEVYLMVLQARGIDR